ncbi:[Fe-Fe] hydrogenase large subunit C-terminal domain-containing protein [Paramaledivibacter caminithermalis]|jgi:iron only hydrogenase large subunit-like protein|uniref:Iron only hydrogenase large subunit, C-terminal domain n=1 Tax=Paramaledivibacter caminithermalis (strain DSM 15212 / CIP 107654 / DViRD3) TaxID=1121301 RepID=A0A1M6MR16_PARC5|nr:[Fe-Fe] hydrogenase large subunit C-terminal domain-containing protein [Paramaledivibacter caminithermalis]SHJ85829.1 Iron only hydrogenase large subunit, C-terminal domain [Paramaledivibacter caminithermalis DSM 15212]
MRIFGEVVKAYWDGKMKDIKDLNELVKKVKEKYDFQDKDIPFIKDHIRIAMGLNPKGDKDFQDELSIVKNSKEIKEPIVAKIDGVCEYCDDEDCKCVDSCKYEAHIYRRGKGPIIENNKCLSCGECVTKCDFGALADKIEFIPLIDFLKDENTIVYAAVAPSIVGQFGNDITMGQIRTAFKILGFKDMVEVALFADILTIKEAFEFVKLVREEKDFYLTSCCCPVWFNLVKKNYPKLFEHMPPSISPMIASSRFLKRLYKDIKVVFISPCIAKKAEAKEPNLRKDIDFVLTFRELREIFEILNINLKELPSDDKDQASFGGRVYARTGGVSFSVKTVVNRLEPRRLIKLKAKKVDGVKSCKQILDELSLQKDIDYNFVEGMGCNGGCVGGPRTNIDVEKATKLVNEFGEDSLIMTPFDNANVMKILRQFGIRKIEEISENNEVSKLLNRE